MKNKILIAVLMGFITVTAYAQKGELNNAQTEYDKYTALGTGKAVSALANTSINNAKNSIDKAAANAKTSALPQTYALKAAIYASLASQDSIPASSAVSYATAVEAQKKAQELDTKGENKKLIDHTNIEMAQYLLNKGVGEYQHKKFDDAYKSFDAARQIIPDDTIATMNTAAAALAAKNYPAVILNYTKLTTLKYSGNKRIYEDLPSIYLVNKDTAAALKSLAEGIAKYPEDNDLRKREIEINLQSGRQSDLIAKIEAAIKTEPKNKTLYYYEGLTYSQIAEGADKDYKKIIKSEGKAKTPRPAKDVASLNALKQKKEENFTKAADMYKKALEIDPDYFEANLNAGYVIISPAFDNYNEAQQMPVDKVKEYNAAMAKANSQIELAKPYLLKAYQIQPKSIDALTNLKSYYLAKQDMANANKIQKEIDALPATPAAQ